MAAMSRRIDRIETRLDRIERRLDLVPAGSSRAPSSGPRADIARARADQDAALVLLDRMGDPADGAADDKQPESGASAAAPARSRPLPGRNRHWGGARSSAFPAAAAASISARASGSGLRERRQDRRRARVARRDRGAGRSPAARSPRASRPAITAIGSSPSGEFGETEPRRGPRRRRGGARTVRSSAADDHRVRGRTGRGDAARDKGRCVELVIGDQHEAAAQKVGARLVQPPRGGEPAVDRARAKAARGRRSR